MWKGGGGVPIFFVLGGFRSQKLSKKSIFLKKSLRRNAVNIGVFAFCASLPWKMQSLNSSLFAVFYACVF